MTRRTKSRRCPRRRGSIPLHRFRTVFGVHLPSHSNPCSANRKSNLGPFFALRRTRQSVQFQVDAVSYFLLIRADHLALDYGHAVSVLARAMRSTSRNASRSFWDSARQSCGQCRAPGQRGHSAGPIGVFWSRWSVMAARSAGLGPGGPSGRPPVQPTRASCISSNARSGPPDVIQPRLGSAAHQMLIFQSWPNATLLRGPIRAGIA